MTSSLADRSLVDRSAPVPVVAPGPAPAWWWWPASALGGFDPSAIRPVLFFPPSGAEPSLAQVLVPHLAGLRFGVLQLPGRGTRADEPAPTAIEPLIDAVATAVRTLPGPAPVLVGHSFGGLLAYGVAARLEELGVPAARLMVVASNAPGRWSGELAADPDRDDPEAFGARRAGRIVTGGGVPQALLEHPQVAARALELTRVDVELSRLGFGVRTISTPMTVIAAKDDTVLAPGACDGWADVAGGPLRRFDVPGDHFFYRAAPQRLVAQLRLELHALEADED